VDTNPSGVLMGDTEDWTRLQHENLLR